MKKIIIKELNESEKKKFEKQLRKAVASYYIRYMQDSISASHTNLKANADSIFEFLIKKHIIAAVENKNIIGFSSFNLERKNKAGQILDTYVHPNFQKQGLGKQLLLNAISRIPKNFEITTEGEPSKQGQKLLKAIGAEKICSEFYEIKRKNIPKISPLTTIKKIKLMKQRVVKARMQ